VKGTSAMTNIYTVYKITNTINNKLYIGYTSKSIEKRFKGHKSAAKSGRAKFQYALRKYGVDNFIIEAIYQSHDKYHTLTVMEPYFIREYDSYRLGYNSTSGGECGDGIDSSGPIWHNGLDISVKATLERAEIRYAKHAMYKGKQKEIFGKLMFEKMLKAGFFPWLE